MKTRLKTGRPGLIFLAMLLCGLLWPTRSTAANKNVWIEIPVNTRYSTKNWVVCKGDEVLFEARQDGHASGKEWTWSGAERLGDPTDYPSQARKIFDTADPPQYYVWATYDNEVAYWVKVYVFNFIAIHFKRNDEPEEYFSETGGGDVVLGETYDFRIVMEGDSTKTRWEMWVSVNNEFTMIRSGTGNAFSHQMGILGDHHVTCFPDLDNDGLPDGPCRVSNPYCNVVGLIQIPLTIKRHAALSNFTETSADTLLATATQKLRKRDRLDDLRCGVQLVRQGAVGTFGYADDPTRHPPLEVWNEADEVSLFNVSGNIKVIDKFYFPSDTTRGVTQMVGVMNCIIKDDAPRVTWAHEVGHGRGLWHNLNPWHRIMHSYPSDYKDSMTSTEAYTYRRGPN